MTGPVSVLIAAAVFAVLWIGLEIHDAWCRRRCTVSRADAAWLSTELGNHDCPVCDRPLAQHSR